MTNANMSAMPQSEEYYNEEGEYVVMQRGGLTKREYFAAMAMQGLLASDTNFNFGTSDAARLALDQADALLQELEKRS